MKLKNFLIESAHWLGMLVAFGATAYSCAASAQQRFSAPDAYYRVHPRTPDNGYSLYERNDSLFAIFSTGDEKYLNVAHGAYEPLENSSVWISTPEDTIQKFGWITDSITWVATDTTFSGDYKCEHEWVYGEVQEHLFGRHNGQREFFGDGYCTLWCSDVNPDGKHCNEHQSSTREKICRKCLFSVIEREKWFQCFVAPPKSEFELLNEKQRAKQ